MKMHSDLDFVSAALGKDAMSFDKGVLGAERRTLAACILGLIKKFIGFLTF